MTFSAIVTLFVVIVASGCLHIAHAQKSLSIYVSPMLGLDTNAGTTSSAPLRTLRAAGLLIQSQPQVVYSISISIDTGIYTNAQDCEFELTALSIGVPLTVTGNGTVFRCAQMSSSAVSVQARIAGFANVSISGLVWSDLQLTCVAWPCAALLVDAADRVIIHDVNVSNVSLVVPNADDAWNLVSPLAINATGAVFIDDAHFEHNSLLVNVSTSNNDAFFFRVGGGAIAVVSEWFALGQATFDTNAVESLTAGRVIGGGAVLIDDKAKKIDVADCVFVNNSVRSDGAAIGGVIAVRSCDTAVDASVEMRVNNSLFDNNHLWSSDSSAQFQGVAIAGVQCGVVAAKSLVALVMDSTRFVGNSIVASGADAQATGGIVRVHSLHATNCSVTNTSLLGVGNVNGGFVALQGVSSVSSCTFDNNVFESNNVNGALVKIDDDDGHVCTGSDMFTFIDNVVTNTAINDTLSLPGGIVCGSSPTGGGGVIRIDLVRCRTDVVNIQGGVFANNNLKYCTGGAVSITGGDISFMGVLVANNTARAGAVFEGHLLSSVDIDSSQFENNTANRVGGVGSFYDVTFLAVHNNTFTKNSAGDRGSVFYFEAVASVVIDGSSMVENTDAFNTSVHFVSLHPMLISVKGKWLGNGILVHGPVKELLVGDSLFVDSPIYVTYDFGTFVHSSLYRFVDSTFQGGSTIVVTDSGDRTQAAAVLQIALTLLNCRFLIDDHLTMNVARGCVTVTSVLTHTSVQNCTFIGTGTGALAPLFIMQNEIATLSMTNCALERTASIVAHSSIVLTNVTFDSCNGVLWAVSVPIISMQSVAIRNALHGSMVRFIDVATADQVQITNVSIANSSANSKVLRLINVKILDVYGLTVSNTTLRDPMSSVVQLSNVSSIYAFQDVAIVNNTFSVGALMLDNIKMLLGRNVTLANNTATVCGGAAFVDDIATLKNLSLTASDNRALCFGNGTIFAPVRIQLVGGGAVVKAMRGVAARITAQLVDPFNVSTPDCAQPVRTLPVNVHAYIGSNSPDTTLCTIPRNSSWCTGSLWFDGDVGESTSVTLKINSLADFLFHAIEPATFQLVVADCMAGFAMQNGRCVECQSASYSFGGMASCRSCPLDAVCRGGSAFESANDTFVAWNANSSDVEVHRCLLGVCGGGAVASNLTVVNHCAPGRTGLLCASCEQQRNASFAPVAPSGGGAACIECNGTNVPVVVALVVVLFGTALFLHMSAHSSSAKTKLLFYYAQIAAIVLPPDFPSDVVTHVLNIRVGAATGAFGGICVANLDHFDLVTVKLVLPIALIACLFVTFVAVHLWRRFATHKRARRVRRSTARVQVEVDPVATEQSEGCETASAIPLSPSVDEQAPVAAAPPPTDFWLWCRFRRTLVAIVLLTYSVTLKTTVDVLDCRSVGGHLVLRSDVRTPCDDHRYGIWANLAYFLLLPYLAIVTLAVPLVLYIARRRNDGVLPRSIALGALYDIYRPEVAHVWETVVLVRRLALGVIDILMPNTISGTGPRYFALNVINTLALASTVHLHPLQSNFEHWLDVFQLSWLLLIGNNLSSLERHTIDAWSRVRVSVVLNDVPLAVFVATPLIVIAGAIFWTTALHVYRAFKKWRMQRR